MKLAAALLERLFYDVPNVRLTLIRVDVYTTFRRDDGVPEQRCILSVVGDRAAADRLPWDELLPHEIVRRFEAVYQLGEHGAALPIEPGPPLADEEEPPSSSPDTLPSAGADVGAQRDRGWAAGEGRGNET
jgi:hypothetical protein